MKFILEGLPDSLNHHRRHVGSGVLVPLQIWDYLLTATSFCHKMATQKPNSDLSAVAVARRHFSYNGYNPCWQCSCIQIQMDRFTVCRYIDQFYKINNKNINKTPTLWHWKVTEQIQDSNNLFCTTTHCWNHEQYFWICKIQRWVVNKNDLLNNEILNILGEGPGIPMQKWGDIFKNLLKC